MCNHKPIRLLKKREEEEEEEERGGGGRRSEALGSIDIEITKKAGTARMITKYTVMLLKQVWELLEERKRKDSDLCALREGTRSCGRRA